MINLGVKREDLETGYYGCAPCCESGDKKDWKKEIVHPTLSLSGRHADLFGIEDLKLGDRVEVTLMLEVTGLRNDSRLTDDKKTVRDVSLTFKLKEASDLVDAGAAEKEDAKESASDASDSSVIDAILPGRK